MVVLSRLLDIEQPQSQSNDAGTRDLRRGKRISAFNYIQGATPSHQLSLFQRLAHCSHKHLHGASNEIFSQKSQDILSRARHNIDWAHRSARGKCLVQDT